MFTRILSAAKYLPEQVVTNEDLIANYNFPKPVDWFEPSGVKERRFAANGESTVSMGTIAARQVLEALPADNRAVDVMIMTSSGCEVSVPGGAVTIAQQVGLKPGITFDLTASCGGFAAAFDVAHQYIQNGCKRALIVSSEIASRHVHYGSDGEHYQLAGVFADGAGAVLLEANEEMGVEGSARGTLPEYCEDVVRYHEPRSDCPGFLLRKVMFRSKDNVAKAFTCLPKKVAVRALRNAGVDVGNIQWFVSHQPRLDMLQMLARQLGIPPERHYINLDRYGNTSSASLPICLADLIESGRLRRGERILMMGMGAGFLACAHVLRY